MYFAGRHFEYSQFDKKVVEAQKAYEADAAKHFDEGMGVLSQTKDFADSGDVDAFRTLVEPLRGNKKETNKLTARIALKLVSCKRCCDGYIQPTMFVGQGDKVSATPLENIPLHPDFVAAMTS